MGLKNYCKSDAATSEEEQGVFLSKNCPRQQGLGQFLAHPRRNSNGWWVSQSLDEQRKCWVFHKNNKYSSPFDGLMMMIH
jgi:hypothetical protein